MRSPRFLFALLLFVVTCAPVITGSAAPVELASSDSTAPSRDVPTDRASRSADRPALPAELITTTTTAPTTTALPEPEPAPVTTVAPTTTAPPTTAAPAPKPAPEPEPEPAAVEVSGSGTGAAAAAVARQQVGKAYKMGAVGPNAFDCSGLIIYAYRQSGVDMPRLTSEGFGKYTKVSRSDLQPGDVVYKPGHVGLYVGDGKMVHASTPRGGVKLSGIDAPGTPTAFYRI